MSKRTGSGWLILAAGCLAATLTMGLAQAAPPATAEPNANAATPAQPAAHGQPKLDIDSATQAELAKLPGIGDAYSQKIIAGRPYKGKDDLLHKKVIPESVYKKIEHMIIAKQSK